MKVCGDIGGEPLRELGTLPLGALVLVAFAACAVLVVVLIG